MRDKDVERVLATPPFSEIDPSLFPAKKSLDDLIRTNGRIHIYAPGDIVIRQGDYGTSAYFVLAGAVRVIIGGGLDEQTLGRKTQTRRSWREALGQLWKNHRVREYRDPPKPQGLFLTQTRIARETKELRVFLPDIERVKSECKTVPITAGNFFGEIAALSRTPRTATVFADGHCQLMEIRWQGLRDIRRRSRPFRDHLDTIYRERSLKAQLAESDLFRGLNDDALDEIVAATEFESYGNFDWYPEYKRTDPGSIAQRIAQEPIIAQEGDYVNEVLLLRAGFARKSLRINHGHRTLGYLGSGDMFGIEEVSEAYRRGAPVALRHTLRAIGYVNVLKVPVHLVEKHVIPRLESQGDLPPAPPEFESSADALDYFEQQSTLDEGLMEFLVSERFNNGTAAMVIDLNRCTGCDDCVRACANAHDNNPRFIRHGKQVDHFLIANACMHCVDPVCMLGCPTGAIHRSSLQGQVVINPSTCIGCANCANNCPYDNIQMVEVNDADGQPIFDVDREQDKVQATKCDLCLDQPTGPACQQACPHDALARIDMRDPASFAQWVSR